VPKVNFVKAAAKDNRVAKKGESYYWWKFRYGSKHMSKTPPRPSQLTQSDFLSRQMELEELRNLKNQMTEAAREIESSVQSTVSAAQSEFDQVQKSIQGGAESAEPRTDWDSVYAVRRQRERIKDRRIEREKALGLKRPRRPLHR
jgi:hypothetical protein